MPPVAAPTVLTLGDWQADRATGRLTRGGEARAIEPKVMDLLFLLASRPGGVFTKDEITAALWPGVTVGDDSLSRCVFKLRRALEDDPKAPRYVETLPKRGYRLIAEPVSDPEPEAPPPPARRFSPARLGLALGVILVVFGAGAVALAPLMRLGGGEREAARLTRQADDYYFQITRADNEAAIALYERILTEHPDHARARSGLANALVQQVLRWQAPPGVADSARTDLAAALASGRTRAPLARAQLERAAVLAESATQLAPQDAAAWKALGFVRSAQGDIEAGLAAQRRAVDLDPDAWDALINLADLYEMRRQPAAALAELERAHAAMGRVYESQVPRVRPWRAEVGVLVADRHAAAGRRAVAERWYREVLAYAPLHPGATAGLARILAARGQAAEAARLCSALVERTGPQAACAEIPSAD